MKYHPLVFMIIKQRTINLDEKMNVATIPLLILAGGRATRLKHLSENLPKYLMPIGENKVFADAHLEWAHKKGFKRIILSIGYLGSMVKDYCGDGSKWQLEINYVDDGAQPLGTGGAVKKSLAFAYTDLAITYGDTILSFDVVKCINQYRTTSTSGALGIMTYYQNEVEGHVCNVTPTENGFIYYNKIQPGKDWLYIDYGFSVLSRSLIESFADKVPLDLAEPLMQTSQMGQLAGYECKERFWEIGSVESLAEFREKL
jgi:NDP-sugar pyrophosphorylase family protein